MAAPLLLQGSVKQGARRSGSAGIDCLEGKQEATSLGRFNPSTASYCDRIQFVLRTEMYPHSTSTQALSPSFSMQGAEDFSKIFKWLAFHCLLSNFSLWIKIVCMPSIYPPQDRQQVASPSIRFLLINPVAQWLGHSPEFRNRAVLSQIPSNIPDELNSHSFLSHLTPVSAWNLSLHSPPCCHRSKSPERHKSQLHAK